MPAGPLPLDAFMSSTPAGCLAAGAAAVEITPPRPAGIWLAGFGAERACSGVHDPLFARALVVAAAGTPLVIVAADLIGLSLARTRRLQQRLTSRYPDAIHIVCTHNHQGPDTLGIWGPAFLGRLPYRNGQDPAYMDFLEARLVACVERALASARPARLHVASGTFDAAGRWVHNERAAVADRELRLIQLDDQAGESIASLVQYACHPETLWKANRQISADFCGVCCEMIEKRLGGTALYINGALGAMVSAAIGHDTLSRSRETFMYGLGRALGRAALRLVGRARLAPVLDPAISVGGGEVSIPASGNRFYQVLVALGVVDKREFAPDMVSRVSFCRLGPASITFLPGEASPALGLEILARVPGKPRLLACLADDELGYLLTPEMFHDRIYAYERGMSPGHQAAVRLVLAVEKLAIPNSQVSKNSLPSVL